MKKILILLPVLCTLFTAFSCGAGSTGKQKFTSLNPYFPAAKGSKWVYINEAPREESIIFTVEVNEMLEQKNGYNLTVSSFPFMTADNTERTLILGFNGEISISDYNGSTGIFIPSPENLVQGYQWKFGIFNCMVSDAAEEIKTEAGNFSGCKYILMTDGFTFSFEMWYKKGTGIVKWGANRTNPPVLRPIYYVLKNYNIKE